MIRCLLFTLCVLVAAAAGASETPDPVTAGPDAREWKKMGVETMPFGALHIFLDMNSIHPLTTEEEASRWDRMFTLKSEMYNGEIIVMRTMADYRVHCETYAAQRENVKEFMRSPTGELTPWPAPSQPTGLNKAAIKQLRPTFDTVCSAPLDQER